MTFSKLGVLPPRLHEQFGYAYDTAWNLNYRTNNALLQTFAVNNLNELSTVSRSGTLTVAGTVGQKTDPVSVTVSGTGLSSGAAAVYEDGSWARAGASPVSGANTYTATATDGLSRTSQDTVSVNLPASVSFAYDANGNLLNDGRRYFEYDPENQLTAVTVSNAWRSEFVYDGLMRRRVRKEYTWSGGWVKTNEVRYVYDRRVVIEERDANNLPLVTYTRGLDLSGDLQEAGGIGGLLARTDRSTLNAQLSTAYYHCDGNGNVTGLLNASNAFVARYSYDPYGNLLASSGPLADANLYRFSSKEYHPNSGLVYYLYRYYEPNLQRWVNRDPLGESGGINLYTFLRNCLVSLIDAFGLKDYSCEETKALLSEMRKENLLDAFKNHSGRGKFDFKVNNPNDTFNVGGQQMDADAFGNYSAGYTSQHAGGIIGYLGVRAGGLYYNFFDAGRVSWISGAPPASFNFDMDSVPHIKAGRHRAIVEMLPISDAVLAAMNSNKNHVCLKP